MKLFALNEDVRKEIPAHLAVSSAEAADYEVIALWGDFWGNSYYTPLATTMVRLAKENRNFVIVFPPDDRYTGNTRVTINETIYYLSEAWPNSLFLHGDDWDRLLRGEKRTMIPDRSWLSGAKSWRLWWVLLPPWFTHVKSLCDHVAQLGWLFLWIFNISFWLP